MTCSLFAPRLFRQFVFVLSISILFTLQLSAQNGGLKDELSHSLSGTTVISTIILGAKAAPQGYRSSYPVETLVYPANNAVAYRMDMGATSTAVTAQGMQRYFDRGTSFEVSGFDLQDGWLELRLKSAGGDSARLRLMLGNGWQSKFDSSSIRAQLACVLVLDQKQRTRKTTPVPVGFGETFSQKEQDTPSKRTHAGAGTGGELFVKFGSTS
jgi:hypothetical protein